MTLIKVRRVGFLSLQSAHAQTLVGCLGVALPGTS